MRIAIKAPAASAPDVAAGQTAALPLGGLGFDWAMMLLSSLFLGGLYLDGWAHNHDKVDVSFFTIWHAFFYSGFLLVALLLAATLLLNHRRGRPWRAALPGGYELSLLGALVFAAGGVGDLLWHELFGIEKDFDALYSPSHLALGLGLGLIVSGPLRAAWQRPGRRLSWRQAGPALLSLAALISTFTFFAMYSHPLVANIAAADHYEWRPDVGQMAGAVSILLTTTLLTAPALLALARWQLPPGSLLLVWGINTVAMAILNWRHTYTWTLLGAMLLGVAAVEALHLVLRPGHGRTGALHLFGFLAPALLMASYFLAMLAVTGTAWTVHLWTGLVVQAGIAGWLLSYLVAPPPLPDQ
ncbi:MAG TPA: hypothetical protein VNK95_13290 [Caldilineaceae bacterium]|nr:hypothetical protein [Caldilineaceae bacterium]